MANQLAGDLPADHISTGGAFAFIVVVLTADEYEDLNEAEYRGRFSTTIPRTAGTAGHGRWALIVRRQGRERDVTHVDFARSTGVVSTFDNRVTVQPFVALSSPVKLAELRGGMAPIHFGALKRASSDRGSELTPSASANLRAALAPWVPDRTWASLAPVRRQAARRQIDIEHSQFDALATGFALAGFHGAQEMRKNMHSVEYSVLEKIRRSPTEPDMMTRDLQHFSWSHSEALKEHIYRFKQRGRILDVVNLNGTRQEAATGVDLLYYNSTFSSFVGVQYKQADVCADQD